MEKKLIIALALSLLVVVLFQGIGGKKRSSPVAKQTQTSERSEAETDNYSSELFDGPEKSGIPAVPKDEKENSIDTGKFHLVFSDVGGSLKKLSLMEYLENGSEEVLIEEENLSLRPFAMESALIGGLDTRKYHVEKGRNSLEYSIVDAEWMEITKRYTFHKEMYYIELAVSVKNLSPRNINFAYSINGPAGVNQTGKVSGRSFMEANAMIDDDLWKARSVKGGRAERTGNVSWVAVKNRYFAVVLKSFDGAKKAIFRETKGKKLSATLLSRNHSLEPGQTKEDIYVFYAGPQEQKQLQAVSADMGDIVNYGIFGAVSKKLLMLLRFFHGIVKNWGVAIILLTLLINIVLFPLTMKSFASMHKMKKIQPHMQKLRELHKDNPQKLNKEMMELYRTYNVNPIGGCLPMLLQMPIFISLYQGLIRSIELKGASFLWIKDLSRPDAVPLPVKLPLIGSSVNILPLLMVGMMVLQQKITQGASAAMSEQQASQQKMMMTMFPLFFGLILYNMPSGLVLYWLTNTILMTTEQGLISKRMNEN